MLYLYITTSRRRSILSNDRGRWKVRGVRAVYWESCDNLRLEAILCPKQTRGTRLRPCPKRRLRLQLRLDHARLLSFNTGRRADLDVAVAEVVVSDTWTTPRIKHVGCDVPRWPGYLAHTNKIHRFVSSENRDSSLVLSRSAGKQCSAIQVVTLSRLTFHPGSCTLKLYACEKFVMILTELMLSQSATV